MENRKHVPNGISHTAPMVYKCKHCGKRYSVSMQFEDECPGTEQDQKIAALEKKLETKVVKEVKVDEVKNDGEPKESTVSTKKSEE